MKQTSPDKPRLGFIGLGMMGAGMARCLMDAGYPITLCANKNRERIDRLLRDGAAEVATPSALAADCDVIVTCVPDAAAVTKLADHIIPALRPGTLWIDATTSLP